MKAILQTALLALTLVLAPVVSSFAGPYEDGIEAYQRGDYTTALQIFRSLAETSDARGQNGLGVMSEWGQGVPQDDAAAVKWYRMAADQGFSKAQVNLGGMYVTGRGVKQDYVEAAKWYRKAAEQGHAKGQYNLGVAYDNGRGVPQDYAEAVKWYRKAAEQGDAQAQVNLGIMYGHGRGVPEDGAEAAKWFRMAAGQGNAHAQTNLGVMYGHGRGVPKDDAEAAKWYRKAAEQGDAKAQYNLGLMYAEGQGVAQDHAEAVKWLRKAAEQGNAGAQARLDSITKGLPDIPTLEHVLGAPALDLAASYLAVDEAVSLVELVLKHGNTLVLNLDEKQVTVTQANAESYGNAYRERLDIYRQAIEQRGFAEIAGRYALGVNAACQSEKSIGIVQMFAVSQRDGEYIIADELVVRQTGFKADLVLVVDDEGQPSEIVFSGVTVEGAVVFSTLLGFNLWGEIEDRVVNLRLNVEDVENALFRKFESESDRQALVECVFTLTAK